MFVIYDKAKDMVPIKVWLKDKSEIEESCLDQAIKLSELPFIHKWVSLMPDAHSGYGMPIGGVIATKGVIIPNAVGVDIGCGVSFMQTNIPVKLLKEHREEGQSLLKLIIDLIMKSIPAGQTKHKSSIEHDGIKRIEEDLIVSGQASKNKELFDSTFPNVYNQVMTLGSGNHFLELQEDEKGNLGIMIHSGSRNFGYRVAKYFNDKAIQLNKEWHSAVPEDWELAFLPVNSDIGKDYIDWMNSALAFAKINRTEMMKKAREIVYTVLANNTDFENVSESYVVDIHHNYASLENHYGENVWVHRKGATRVRQGELGIIPGAMGSNSYIVTGLQNPESFHSCSHGAGRKMSRKKALEKFTAVDILKDLSKKEVILGKQDTSNIADECQYAYKDIDSVMMQQEDLVTSIKKLKTIGVIKG
jgi:tRNA-splicing ligase RtcB